MPLEPAGYRGQLESVIKAFPCGECLNVREVATYCGITEKTAAKRFVFVGKGKGKYITRSELARQLIQP